MRAQHNYKISGHAVHEFLKMSRRLNINSCLKRLGEEKT